jgi:threonine/homoserine/homoserine lactone efflux protein
MIPVIEIILKGILLGFIVSMPLGPVSIILINRTIKRGFLSGFFSGLGLASADTLLAILAALGFTVIIGFINQERLIITVVAGIVVIGVGIKVLMSNPVRDYRKRDKANKSLWRDFYSVFVLSVTNPYTVLIFVAFFSGIHVSGNIRPEQLPFYLIPGVFAGAITWWLALTYFLSRFKKKIRLRAIVRINALGGIVIIIIGVLILVSIFTRFRP